MPLFYRKSKSFITFARILNNLGGGTGGGGNSSFYSVQSAEDAARLAKGGEPWPAPSATKALVGKGFYAWEDESVAQEYLGKRMTTLTEKLGADEASSLGLKTREFQVPTQDLEGLKTVDLRTMTDDEANAWLDKYSYYSNGVPEPHGFDHVIRGAGMGTEHYFSPEAFKYFTMIGGTP